MNELAVNPSELGRPGHVAAGLGECSNNVRSFKFLDDLISRGLQRDRQIDAGCAAAGRVSWTAWWAPSSGHPIDLRPHRKRPSDRIAELANVTWPARARKLVDQIWRQGRLVWVDPFAGAEFAGKVFGQDRNVVEALAKWRHLNANDRQPVVQIFAKTASVDFSGQASVGRCDDTNINSPRDVVANPTDFETFQCAKKLGLKLERKLTDFVEKKGSAIGGFESAEAIGDRSGKRPTEVAKKFALDQLSGYGRAIKDDEWTVGTGRGVVEGFGGEVFAGSGLTFDKNGGVARCDPLEDGKQLAHPERRATEGTKPTLGRQRKLDQIIEKAKSQKGVAAADLRIGPGPAVVHSDTINKRPVSRTGVEYSNPVPLDPQSEVVATHGWVGKDQVARLRGSDVDFGTRTFKYLRAARSSADFDPQLARAQFGTESSVLPQKGLDRAVVRFACQNS